jgi:hypothetical protein
MPATSFAPASFLVGRRNETGNFEKVSASGKAYQSDACHPLVDGMTEAAHYAIGRAAVWMSNEEMRPCFVDVDVDGVWRVSLI